MSQPHLRIGFFSDFYLPVVSGIATSMQLLTQGLRDAGHDVTIFAPRFPNYEDDEPKVRRVPSFRYMSLPEVYVAVPGTPRTTWALRSLELDVVHVHSPLTVGMMAYITARAKRLPLVYTYHTSLTDYTHYMKVVGGTRPAYHAARWFSAATANLSDQVVVPSKKFKRLLESQNVHRPVHAISNGIDLSNFRAATHPGRFRLQLGLGADSPLLIFVGRIDPEKNIDFLLDAFERVAERFPNAHFALAGDGAARPGLEAKAASLASVKRIHFLGMMDRADLPDLLHDSTMFLSASVTETQCLSMVEAIATGLPVVAVRDEAFEGIVEEGGNGHTVPMDLQTFTDKVCDLLADRPRLERYSQRSYELSANFSIETQVQKMLKLYRAAIHSAKTSNRLFAL